MWFYQMVNILISTYNGAKYIEEQLNSIFLQTYQDFKVYIRDDGSLDGTQDIIKNYIKENNLENRIETRFEQNVGFCCSFFELLKWASKGDYWAFCDQDDYWYPDKLKLAVNWMLSKNNDNIPLLYHSSFQLGNSDFSKKKIYKNPKFHYQFYNSITSNIFFGFSITINRGLYEKLILADPKMIKYHDWFAAMITAAFGEYYLSPNIEAIHRQHKANSSPLFFFKKIPYGISLLRGDLFYNQNAKEFMRLYGDKLNKEDKEILSWFVNKKNRFKKVFYLKRWNPQIIVEGIIRILMLIGKI